MPPPKPSSLSFLLDALLRPWRLGRARQTCPQTVLALWLALVVISLSALFAMPSAAPFLVAMARTRGLSPEPALGALALGLVLAFDLGVRFVVIGAVGALRRRPSPWRGALAPAATLGIGILPGLALLALAASFGLNAGDRTEALHRLTLALLFYVMLAATHYAAQVRAWLEAPRVVGWALGTLVWALTLSATWALPTSGGSVRAFVVDGASMAPTLVAGDRLLVEQGGEVQPGDLVIVRTQGGGEVARRVVGVGGDTIGFDGAGTLRNGVAAAAGELLPAEDVCATCVTRVEHIGSHSYRIAGGVLHRFDTPEPITVPAGQVYVVGDYRDHRSDELHRGLLPMDRLVGVAFWRYGDPERQGALSTR